MNNDILDVPVNEFMINGKYFQIHPVYDLYGSSKDGFVPHITRRKPMQGNENYAGYLYVTVRGKTEGSRKICGAGRFIWKCYNGVIEDKQMLIAHINNKKEDNRLCNLLPMTKQQNYDEAAKNRDHSLIMKNLRNRKYVRAVNCNDNMESFYNSLYAVNQHLGINAGIVKMACEGLNHVKSVISKKDGFRYKFNYISKEELPENYKKSANKHPKRKDNQE
jgi:hypothetical protein